MERNYTPRTAQLVVVTVAMCSLLSDQAARLIGFVDYCCMLI